MFKFGECAMFRSYKVLCATFAVSSLTMIASAGAVPITDVVDSIDTTITFGQTPSPCPSSFVCAGSSLSFVHDITDDGYTIGGPISAATLAIHLTDPLGGGSESYQVVVGDTQVFSSANVPSGGGGSVDTFPLTMSSLQDLALDGKINIVVTALSGSFAFADSLLTAVDRPQPLPEPATLSLFGIFGVGGAFRMLRSKARSLWLT